MSVEDYKYRNDTGAYIELQIENLENDLGVYSSFSLSPGSYPSTNVFFVEGTPSKFWLSINHPALAEFHNLIKVL